MVTVEVDAGICGKHAVIKATCEDMQTVAIDITTDCPHIREMAGELKEINAMEEIFGGIGETRIYQTARKYVEHAACIVPAAMVKAAEAACGLALPKNASITINRE